MGGASYPGPMPPEVNRPDVVADISAVFERYEAALVANDVDILDELFWDSPDVVRFGLADRQHGFAGGLPVGLLLVAPPGREDLLVAVGRLAEAALS